MSELNYIPSAPKEHVLESSTYEVESFYNDAELMEIYKRLKANIIDINVASIVKTVQGTEQDFLELMNRAKMYLYSDYNDLDEEIKRKILSMFQNAVFGYYVLTPLLNAQDVSDIKVLAWNRIVCKASGRRYETNVSFMSEQDYNDWYDRLRRIHRIKNNINTIATYCTDRKCDDAYYLRIDWQDRRLVSTDDNNIHIRKIPTEKYSVYALQLKMLKKS